MARQKASALATWAPLPATAYLFQGRLHAAAALSRKYLEPVQKKDISMMIPASTNCE